MCSTLKMANIECEFYEYNICVNFRGCGAKLCVAAQFCDDADTHPSRIELHEHDA